MTNIWNLAISHIFIPLIWQRGSCCVYSVCFCLLFACLLFFLSISIIQDTETWHFLQYLCMWVYVEPSDAVEPKVWCKHKPQGQQVSLKCKHGQQVWAGTWNSVCPTHSQVCPFVGHTLRSENHYQMYWGDMKDILCLSLKLMVTNHITTVHQPISMKRKKWWN